MNAVLINWNYWKI